MNSLAEPTTPNNVINSKKNIFTRPKWPSSRRSPSLSPSPSVSSSSSSSFRSFSHGDSPPPSPPQRIPFSWETIPGIPKHQIVHVQSLDSSRKPSYLPLPPPAAPVSTTTKPNCKKHHIVCTKDPFFAALLECSKDGDDDEGHHKLVYGSIWKGPAKSLRHRFGFVNLSCKNSSSVAQSLVFLPREQPRRVSYGLVKKRSG